MNRLQRNKGRARRPRRGSAIVEAALVLAPTMLMWIAIFDIGQFMMRQQGMVERVRDGCRYAVTAAYNETEIRNVVLYGEPSPPTPPQVGLLGLRASMIAVSHEDVGNGAAERITIRVENYPLLLFTPGLARSGLARPITQSITRESLGGSGF